ncbi:MAG: Eco57I restriction-modification methylase domain-containing protein [Verrucomicrobia bacterium]|nr:Eco57I restriction-modification methylase domain-containing protein [Verrucomicrobiota bacterium]
MSELATKQAVIAALKNFAAKRVGVAAIGPFEALGYKSQKRFALDPELSGKVFENLLAAYNPETGATARKQTGSFYTPRDIVNYMVDEALIAYLETRVAQASSPASSGGVSPPGPGGTPGQPADGTSALQQKLRHLFAYNDELHRFTPPEVDALIAAIDAMKSLDPAVGSGAFPMGILHKLVFILGKLDPRNEKWKERQIQRVRDAMTAAERIEDATIRERALRELEQQIVGVNEAFERNELDYGRKLYLIENCIYGVDIQPIAVPIAKMRFFISLIVDQRANPRSSRRESAQTSKSGQGDQSRLTSAATEWNMGIRPLPNLETKFVAANTLIAVERRERQGDFLTEDTAAHQKLKLLRQQLTDVRHRHFIARSLATKAKCREQDSALRNQMSRLLEAAGLSASQSRQLAGWDPYDQNASAGFFDPEWMFGIADGFHIALGNPPYVRHETISDFRDQLAPHYETAASRADLFVFFFERGVRLLGPCGVLCYISSNKYFRAAYGAKLRQFLTEKMAIHRIVDFGDAPVFTAIAYASIFIATREKPGPRHLARTLTWTEDGGFDELSSRVDAQSSKLEQTALKPEGWNFSSSNNGLLEKLRGAGTPLKEYVGGRCYYGIKTGLNDAFVIDDETRKRLISEDPKSTELIRPWLRGRDVKRWQARWAGLYAIVFPFGFHSELDRFPAVLRHLKKFEADLRKRGQCTSSRSGAGTGQHHWLELDNNPKPSYLEEFTRPKVIIPAIERACAFAFDDAEYFSNDKTTICVSDEARFLCGVLNSSVIWWVIRQVAAERQNDYYEFKPMYVSRLPVPKASARDKQKLTGLVDRIVSAKKKNPAADTTALEREIDQQVYALYGLTAEEIQIVEEASK